MADQRIETTLRNQPVKLIIGWLPEDRQTIEMHCCVTHITGQPPGRQYGQICYQNRRWEVTREGDGVWLVLGPVLGGVA